MTPSRREFLTAATAAAGLAALGCARALPAADEKRMRAHRLALGEWSLHRTIRAGELDPLDFPAFARNLDMEGVDHVNQFFAQRAGDAAYFRELRRRADDAGVRSVLLLCDEELALGDPDPAKRMLAVDRHLHWVDAAEILGCDAIRVNAYSEGPPDEQMRLCAEGLYRLCDVAAPRGVGVLVENHGGLSSRGDWLAALLDAVGHPAIGALPDFGNWQFAPGQWYDRYTGVRELMPRALAVSAKAHDFDASGEETSTDFGRMLDVVASAGDVEWIEVEYEGDRLREADGIAATVALIRRHAA